jgi:hypothetical protein
MILSGARPVTVDSRAENQQDVANPFCLYLANFQGNGYTPLKP